MVEDVLSGEYESVFKGRGIEFEEVREYMPGDEIKSIDWNVTARMGKPYIKKYIEERELSIMFLVDLSASGNFASSGKIKNELAAELCAVLAFSAVKNNDKIGLIIFTDKVEKYIPPQKGKKHVLRVIREVLWFKPENKKTNIGCALEFLGRVTKHKSVAFVISDFIAPDYKRPLQVSGKRHDLIALKIEDPRETQLPDVGLVELFDEETGNTMVVDTSNKNFRTEYEKRTRKQAEQTDRLLASTGVDRILIRTDKPYMDPILKFFKTRVRRKNR